MYLKRLEIQGFKSFAKRTVMEFETGITAIVGPNGSGKSNTADCLRWVLGEQSAKMMRGKKSEDVIFAGSDKRSRGGFAEVIATFDNTDRKIPIDSAEVSIGRRVSRSGESEYLINGNKARLLDIIDLVLKSNIGTSRYTVIGQGTIDQMILAGPSEIKNLIDEASGVKVYYIKRDRTLKRLEQTAQNLMRAEDLIKELEPRVKSLRRQAKRMEARAEIEVELKAYQKEHFSYQWWSYNLQIISLNSQITELQGQASAYETQIQKHLMQVEQFESNASDALSLVKQDQEALQNVLKEKNALIEQVSLISGKLENLKTASGDQGSLEIQKNQIETSLQETKNVISNLAERLIVLQKGFTKLSEMITSINNQINDLYQTDNSQSEVNWEHVSAQVIEFNQNVKEFQNIIEQAETLSEVRHFAGGLFKSWEKLQVVLEKPTHSESAMEDFQQAMKSLAEQKDALLAEQNKTNAEISKLNAELQFLQSKDQSLQKDLLQVNLELGRITSGSSDDFVNQTLETKNALQQKIQEKIVEQQTLEQKISEFYNSEASLKMDLQDADKKFRQDQQNLSAVKDQITKLQIEKAKLETQNQAVELDIISNLGESVLQEIAQNQNTVYNESLVEKISKLKHQLELIGGVDELTIQEYHETEARFTGLEAQILDLKKGMDDLRSVMDELDANIKEQFTKAFHQVNERFEQYFRMLFNGGRAFLALVKPNEELNANEESLVNGEESESLADENGAMRKEEKIIAKYEHGGLHVAGVDIKATPPGKKLTSIQSLSGGERSLTSIALLCSLLTCFPSPFVVLDEVDAALDEANTIRFGQILGKLAHQTQFITITHNRETMSQAGIIYGVTMGDDGASQLLSIKMDQAEAYAKSS